MPLQLPSEYVYMHKLETSAAVISLAASFGCVQFSGEGLRGLVGVVTVGLGSKARVLFQIMATSTIQRLS